jgi:hypothetical protein
MDPLALGVWLERHAPSYSMVREVCPEMADVPEEKPLLWRKSSFSMDSANCVEFAPGSERVGLRDSKDPDGPSLWFTLESWRDFVATVVADEPASPSS